MPLKSFGGCGVGVGGGVGCGAPPAGRRIFWECLISRIG